MLADEILILGLELPVQIGVPDAERAAWQVLRADVILRPAQAFEAMNDEIGRTVDYEAAANALKALAAARPRCLIETLAAEMADLVITSFGAGSVKIELRKRILPGTDAVAVRLERFAKPMEERLVS
jgi:dihydroneopterin aldolase